MKTYSRLSITVLGLLLIGLALSKPEGSSAASLSKMPREAVEKRVALLNSRSIDGPKALQEAGRPIRERFLSFLPPDDKPVFADGGLVVFDQAAETFKDWALTPEELNGVTVYPIVVAEDPDTRETYFLNGANEEIDNLPAPQGYNPYSWLAKRHPELYAKGALEALRVREEVLRDPSRISVLFYLLPKESVEAMAEAQVSSISGQSSLSPNRMMAEGSLESVTNLVIFSVESLATGNRLGVTWPESFTSPIEIIACTNFAATGWFPVSTELNTWGSNSLFWTDTAATGLVTRYYLAVNAVLDSDGDGLTDAYERHLYGTDETLADSDGDGMPDGWELSYGLNPTVANGAGDADGDGVSNYDEYRLHRNPLRAPSPDVTFSNRLVVMSPLEASGYIRAEASN